MVVVGLAVTDVPVVPDNPVAGLQVYVLAPPAVSVVFEPLHIETLGDTVTVGFVHTVTVTVLEFIHPLTSVPVTV